MKKPIPFGKYFLLDRINVGGMAEVFRAKTLGVEGFERVVALKRILPNIAEDEEFITMFIDEAKIAVQLSHANIAQIFDLGRVEDSHFIALEFVHGKDLRYIYDRCKQKLIDGSPVMPVAMTCFVVMKACEGLDYAHNKRDTKGQELHLVHRDVSPQNILISYDGEVKLIDFGIAKSVSKVGQTEIGTVKGNLRFMSPEQAQGLPVDGRSDLFSLGMSIYFTQAGESLYTASGPYDLLLLAAKGPQPADLARIEALSPPLAALLRGALAPVLDHRYPSAQVFLEDVLPLAPSDGARRLAALLLDIFGEELRAQEQRFSDAVGTSLNETAQTIQRSAIKQGAS
jgi:serine/threonine protein kinase